jgi:D-arabinitol dehydrogenase (NADP+)
MIGAGPTGLVLAQLLKLNGGCHVTLAANAGIKMELAQKLDAADEYIFLDRKNPEKQWEQINSDNPYVRPPIPSDDNVLIHDL